jgi:hypothetical protein
MPYLPRKKIFTSRQYQAAAQICLALVVTLCITMFIITNCTYAHRVRILFSVLYGSQHKQRLLSSTELTNCFIYIYSPTIVQFNHINFVTLLYMFWTLNFGSSSGTRHFKLHTFTSIGTIVHTVKTEYHEFLTIVCFSTKETRVRFQAVHARFLIDEVAARQVFL